MPAAADGHLHDPQTLYRHWEEQQWNPFDIDLVVDVEQWPTMSGEDRDLMFWALSSLMVAEERITTKFSGLVGAYGSEEEATFLATQQVDEARHMQFYARFQDEVIADRAAIADHVARARERSRPPSRMVFDEALVQAHERLVANPADPRAKVAFVTTYHLVIEGTLGLTAFSFITRYLEREGPAPRVRRRATRRSTTTSSATSATASGTSARPSPTTRRSASRYARRCASCCPPSPTRSTPPDRGNGTDWKPSAPAPRRSAAFALDRAEPPAQDHRSRPRLGMNNERLTIALEPPETPTSREAGVENLEFPMVISRIPRRPRTRSTQ